MFAVPGQGLYWSHFSNFIEVTRLLSRIYILLKSYFMHFSGDICKNAVLKVQKNSKNKVFVRAPFSVIWIAQCTTYNYIENGLHRKGFLWPVNVKKRTGLPFQLLTLSQWENELIV